MTFMIPIMSYCVPYNQLKEFLFELVYHSNQMEGVHLTVGAL